jgi:anti-sigma B factor antagonist
MEKFRIIAVPGEGTCTLVLSGETDLDVADDIVQLGSLSIDDPDIHRLVIDLKTVTFIDSTGLGALVTLNNLAQGSSRRFELSHVPDRVERLLTITDSARSSAAAHQIRSPLHCRLTPTPSTSRCSRPGFKKASW